VGPVTSLVQTASGLIDGSTVNRTEQGESAVQNAVVTKDRGRPGRIMTLGARHHFRLLEPRGNFSVHVSTTTFQASAPKAPGAASNT
jgi:hypothetical protein